MANRRRVTLIEAMAAGLPLVATNVPGNEDAVVAAVLHRLERAMNYLQEEQTPKSVRITFVVLMGKPLIRKRKKKRHRRSQESGTESDDDNETRDEQSSTAQDTAGSITTGTDDESSNKTSASTTTEQQSASSSAKTNGNGTLGRIGVNPRVAHPEEYSVHSTPALLRRLVRLMMDHYPERLYKVIIAPGKRRGYGYFGTAVGAQLAIHNNITSARTRSKCFILHRLRELREYIDKEELITIAGGYAPILPSAYEC